MFDSEHKKHIKRAAAQISTHVSNGRIDQFYASFLSHIIICLHQISPVFYLKKIIFYLSLPAFKLLKESLDNPSNIKGQDIKNILTLIPKIDLNDLFSSTQYLGVLWRAFKQERRNAINSDGMCFLSNLIFQRTY
jgi:hypothetical protein